MSELAAQPEETTQDQPEQIETGSLQAEEAAPFNDSLAAQVAAARAEILGHDEEEEPQPGLEASVEPQEEEAEEQEPSEEDAEAERVKMQFAAEKRAREEREQLKADREAWEAEQAEKLEALAKFEASREDLRFDPLSHLEAAELSDEELMDLGREIFFKFMPEHVTPEMKTEMALKQKERRLSRLERQLSKAKEEPKTPKEDPRKMDPEEYQAYEAEYKASLANAAEQLSAEQFPLAAQLDKAQLQSAMFGSAVDHVRNNPGAGDLTPLQTLQAVEKYLQDNPLIQNKSEEAQETKTQPEVTQRPKQTAPRSIRNRAAAAKPNHKEPKTLEEKLALRDAQVRAKYGF